MAMYFCHLGTLVLNFCDAAHHDKQKKIRERNFFIKRKRRRAGVGLILNSENGQDYNQLFSASTMPSPLITSFALAARDNAASSGKILMLYKFVRNHKTRI